MRSALPWLFVAAAALVARGETRLVDFEDTGIDAGGYYDGSDGAGGFVSGHDSVFFGNENMYGGMYWEGFALSRVNDTETEGYLNQFAVYHPGTDAGGNGTYAIGYCGFYGATEITLPCERAIARQIRVNNTTYAALSMLNGDSFAKKFGGRDGTDEDWFMLTITGNDAAGNPVGHVDVMLADFRFDDPADDYIVDRWMTVDLTPLGDRVASLSFSMSSSDTGIYGMNTPSYFAIDDFEYIPVRSGLDATFDNVDLDGGHEDASGDGFTDLEVHFSNTFTDWGYGITSWDGFVRSAVRDTSTPGYDNEFAVWSPGHDLSTNGNYAICYDAGIYGGGNVITFPRQALVEGFFIANTTYAALAMRDGCAPARKFKSSDWFKVTISATDGDGSSIGTKDVFLARNGSIVSDWTWVDLSGFGPSVKTLSFTVSSSDTGDWGINTPTYFAMDGMRYLYTFSGGTGLVNGNDTDEGVPGFIGGLYLGDSEDGGSALNPAFAGWATSVADYSPAPGVSSQDEFTGENWTLASRALGPVTGDNFDIVSLGDLDAGQLATNAAPGSITLAFATPITDKDGPDFAVFENAYFVAGAGGKVFAELGYVEVSSDGTHFTRFPSEYIDLGLGGKRAYANIDPRGVFNLCGKHVNAYGESWGTPFDLSQLADCADVRNGVLDLSAVTHVRIVDIPGDGTFKDSCDPAHGILDAWLTWSSGGVDLEAVGVLNSSAASRVKVEIIGNGEVSPLGYPGNYVSVLHGESVTFDFTPSNGMAVAALSVDGVARTPSDTLTLENLQDDHVVRVTFGVPQRLTSQGVPYSWLAANGLIADEGVEDGTAEAAALADTDNDGFQAWHEYFAGTNPNDASDFLRIIAIDRTSDECAITWLGGTNGAALPFGVVVGNDLNFGVAETNAVPARSPDGTNVWRHATGDSRQRFYKVMVLTE